MHESGVQFAHLFFVLQKLFQVLLQKVDVADFVIFVFGFFFCIADQASKYLTVC